MTHQRVAHTAGQQCLAWLLLLAVALMGLTITRQQALGSLHSHAPPRLHIPSTVTTAVSSLANNWKSRWQRQKVLGHGQLQLDTAANAALWTANTASHAAHGHMHDHDALERHHHAADDATVVALDGAAELAGAADSPANGGAILLPAAGLPGGALVLQAVAQRTGPWPAGRAVAFVSLSVPPPLRPPTSL